MLSFTPACDAPLGRTIWEASLEREENSDLNNFNPENRKTSHQLHHFECPVIAISGMNIDDEMKQEHDKEKQDKIF